MNKIYKIIRCRKNGSIVVASELAKGNKKSLTSKLLALAVSATLLTTTTALAATIDVTENNQVTSTYYDSTSKDPLIINFSDPNNILTFENTSTTGSIKAKDNKITLQVNGDPLKAGGNLIFENNKNKSHGGAIYVEKKENILNLSSLNSISFIGNVAGKNNFGSGGGLLRLLLM